MLLSPILIFCTSGADIMVNNSVREHLEKGSYFSLPENIPQYKLPNGFLNKRQFSLMQNAGLLKPITREINGKIVPVTDNANVKSIEENWPREQNAKVFIIAYKGGVETYAFECEAIEQAREVYSIKNEFSSIKWYYSPRPQQLLQYMLEQFTPVQKQESEIESEEEITGEIKGENKLSKNRSSAFFQAPPTSPSSTPPGLNMRKDKEQNEEQQLLGENQDKKPWYKHFCC